MCDSNKDKEKRSKSLERKNLKRRAELEVERLIYMVMFWVFGLLFYLNSSGAIGDLLAGAMIAIALYFTFTWEVKDEL